LKNTQRINNLLYVDFVSCYVTCDCVYFYVIDAINVMDIPFVPYAKINPIIDAVPKPTTDIVRPVSNVRFLAILVP